MKKERPTISVIVPTLNEGNEVLDNLALLRNDPAAEIIIVDAQEVGRANRAFQMNEGVRRSQGSLLVFLHADTKIDPADLIELSQLMHRRSELVGGAFRFALDRNGFKDRFIEFGVWLRERVFQLPYGDQAIFIRKTRFEELGGYPEVPILEDILLIQKMKALGPLFFYPKKAVTSARRWERHGYLKTTLVNWTTMILWRLGVSLEMVVNFRRRIFHDPVRGSTQKTSARNHAETA